MWVDVGKCEGEGALRWGRRCAGVGARTLTQGRMYANAGANVRISEGEGA